MNRARFILGLHCGAWCHALSDEHRPVDGVFSRKKKGDSGYRFHVLLWLIAHAAGVSLTFFYGVLRFFLCAVLCNFDPLCCVSIMVQADSGLSEVWAALRRHGLQALAPAILRSGARQLSDLRELSPALLGDGVQAWQIDILCPGDGQGIAGPAVGQAPRWDAPVSKPRQRASLTLALAAASPNNRKRSLEELDLALLAATTRPAVDSRVRVYETICRAWEVPCWPVTHESLRCFSASLKQGHYRSVALYFSAIFGHQQRVLTMPVEDFLKQAAKSFIRSVTRGMGPSHLKDSFDVQMLARVPAAADVEPFDPAHQGHARDVGIIAAWFMLRELELAAARHSHLQVSGATVTLLIPVHKTDQVGSLTSRSLLCACRVRVHELCPFHAAVRHLFRGCPAKACSQNLQVIRWFQMLMAPP